LSQTKAGIYLNFLPQVTFEGSESALSVVHGAIRIRKCLGDAAGQIVTAEFS